MYKGFLYKILFQIRKHNYGNFSHVVKCLYRGLFKLYHFHIHRHQSYWHK